MQAFEMSYNWKFGMDRTLLTIFESGGINKLCQRYMGCQIALTSAAPTLERVNES